MSAVVEPLGWFPGLVTALVACSLLAIDQIAVELENPFPPKNLGYLPLDALCGSRPAHPVPPSPDSQAHTTASR